MPAFDVLRQQLMERLRAHAAGEGADLRALFSADWSPSNAECPSYGILAFIVGGYKPSTAVSAASVCTMWLLRG